MADELLSALGKLRREELASDPAQGDPVHAADPTLTTTERNRVLDAVFTQLGAADASAPVPQGSAPAEAKVLSPARWRSAALLGAVLAIAAAVVLVLARPGGGTRYDEGAALPSFSITRLEGGASAVRSDPGTRPLQLRSPHDAIDLVITPSTRVHDELGVVVVARPTEGAPRLATITKQVERSADGAIRIKGPLDQFIALDPGAWKLEWLVGRVGAEPTTLAAVDDAKAAGAWRRVTMEAIIASD